VTSPKGSDGLAAGFELVSIDDYGNATVVPGSLHSGTHVQASYAAYEVASGAVVAIVGTLNDVTQNYDLSTWRFDGSSWQEVDQRAPATPFEIVYHPGIQRVIAVGTASGGYCSGQYTNIISSPGTYVLGSNGWQSTTIQSPQGKMWPMLIGDPDRGVVVMVGGSACNCLTNSACTAGGTDTWQLSLTAH
jgi:hypothetical protein